MECVYRVDKLGAERGTRAAAARCFIARYEEQDEAMFKWIFACNQHPSIREAFLVLQRSQVLQAVGITVEGDRAPRNKHATAVGDWLTLQGGGGKGKGKGAGKGKDGYPAQKRGRIT